MKLAPEIRDRLARMLHLRTGDLGPGDPIPEPLVSASIYQLPDEPRPDRTYGRTANPTVQAVEARLAILEDAPTKLFASGMAAYSALFHATLKAGDRLLLLSDGYYSVRHYLDQFLSGFGVELVICPAKEFAEKSLDGFRLAVIESPTNPRLDIIDIAAAATRAREAGCLLAVDNSVCTPVLQQPLDLGADIVLAADTKATSGHSDVLTGHVSSRDEELMARVHSARTLAGGIAGPFEAWLMLRGLETLDVRLQRMCANAESVAEILASHPAVGEFLYPDGTHPQMAHPGTLIGATFADKPTAERFIELTELFVPTTSFGGVHSAADRRARWGDDVPEGFLRLSIGCEPTEVLVEAVRGALDRL